MKKNIRKKLFIIIIILCFQICFSCSLFFEQVPMPIFTPTAGTYSSAQIVTIRCSLSGVTIKYTLDGSNPTHTHGTTYLAPLTISSTKTIKAIAFKNWWNDSKVATAIFNINTNINEKVATPVITPSSGIYTGSQTITISCATSGATIRYTLNGDDPTPTSGDIYNTSFLLEDSRQIKAIAYKNGMENSNIASVSYTIKSFSNWTMIVGGVYSPYDPHGIVVSGNYAYIADGQWGLKIIDISDPSSAYQRGSIDDIGYSQDVYVIGNYAYVACGENGLRIIDVSNVSTPTLVSTATTTGGAISVFVSGKYAYVATDYSSIEVINISNPSSPQNKASLNVSGSISDIYISGNYLYLAMGEIGIDIIDISNPEAPQHKANINTLGDAFSVFVVGSYAFVGCSNIGLQIIDVSDPLNWFTIKTVNINYDITDVFVYGNYAHVLFTNYDNIEGIITVDIYDTPNSSIINTWSTNTGLTYIRLFITGNFAFLVGTDWGLVIIGEL